MQYRDWSAYNKRNYCIQVHVYLFVGVHMHISIGLTVMHI